MSDAKDMEALRLEVAALRTDVKELISAWQTAKGLVRFVKFVGAMAAAITAIWALIRIGKGV